MDKTQTQCMTCGQVRSFLPDENWRGLECGRPLKGGTKCPTKLTLCSEATHEQRMQLLRNIEARTKHKTRNGSKFTKRLRR